MTILSKKEGWTDSQLEIWKNVETYTELIMKGDVNGFLEYFHNEYSGWNYSDMLPVSKYDLRCELLEFPKHTIDSYNLVPLVINIFKEIAIIHYYFSINYMGVNGKKINKRGRNTDILIYQNNKWLLVGDHVGILDTNKL